LKLNNTTIQHTLLNWQTFLKSRDFLPIGIKFSAWILIPIITYLQDFSQVFNLAISDSEAQYVLVVPFAIAFFFYRRRKAFAISRPTNQLHDFMGISLCILALFVYITGSYSFYSLQLHLVSLPIFVAGITLLIFGVDVLKLLVFPIALLTFMSPFPLFFMDALGGNLLASDGALAAAVLNPFIPIEIIYQPIVILTTVTTAGETVQFSLSAACSGIYSLTAFLFCAVVLGYLAQGSIIKKILYGVLAILAAYFLNVFRIVITVILGNFYGLTLATEFFHTVGGTVLAFFGTLLLLTVGSKLLKLSFISKNRRDCLSCMGPLDVCVSCGRVLHWKQRKLNWKRIAIALLFVLVCADLIVQASAVNYNVAGKESALPFNPITGETDVLTNTTGYSNIYMGRETIAENLLGLNFVGDYLLTRNQSNDKVYAIFETSDLQSKFHTWEGCLNYQSYEINIEKITYVTIYDQNTNIVNGEIITASAPTLHQKLVLVYWFDSLNLETNGTTTNYAVKMTLLKYIPDINNQTDTAGLEAAKTSLMNLSRTYEEAWSQYKQKNSTFVVDLYKNSTAFMVVSVALVAVSVGAITGQRFIVRSAAKKKIAALPEADKALLKNLTSPTYPNNSAQALSADKLDTLSKQQIVHEKVIAVDDQVYVKWVPYYSPK
jgi:exosortase